MNEADNGFYVIVMRAAHSVTEKELRARTLLPSMPDRAFKGEL